MAENNLRGYLCCVMAALMIIGLSLITAAAAPSERAPVILDAGHGGEDGGAVSPSGVAESGLNLAITLKTEKLLGLFGVDTLLVRAEDITIGQGDTMRERKVSDIRARAAMTHDNPEGILVSIHQNSFTDSRYYGAQVFYSETDGSRELAELAQESLRLGLDTENDRQVKSGREIYLLENAGCTAVLIECGFLTNEGELSRLKDDAYQKKIAASIASALLQYR